MPRFRAALAHERKLVAARHALVVVRGGLIAVEVRCRETADQNDGVEHDRFISRVGQRPASDTGSSCRVARRFTTRPLAQAPQISPRTRSSASQTFS
jgi:hypothetical protein